MADEDDDRAPGDLSVRRLSRALGAEVSGVDVRELTVAQVEGIREALVRHQVLFFRQRAPLNDDEHLAFAALFGPPRKAPLKDDWVTVFVNDADTPPYADDWHTDSSNEAEPPALGVLVAVDIPPFGGDTMWASLYAAYELLSPQMQALAASLHVLHRSTDPDYVANLARLLGEEQAAKMGADRPSAVHPLVRTHPVTGRTVLYLSPNWTERIVGMSDPESELLLGYFNGLLDHPTCSVRHRWNVGDVVVWDERCTNHRALGDHYPMRREVRRIHVGAPSSPWP